MQREKGRKTKKKKESKWLVFVEDLKKEKERKFICIDFDLDELISDLRMKRKNIKNYKKYLVDSHMLNMGNETLLWIQKNRKQNENQLFPFSNSPIC